MGILHDIAAASGLLGGGVVVVKEAIKLAAKHAEKKAAEARAMATVEATKTREEEDTRRHGLRAQTAAHSECMKLVEAQGERLGVLSEKYGKVAEKLDHCEQRHDHQEGVVLALRARIEALEGNSNPPPAIAAE